MEARCPNYQCVTPTISGLVQQIVVSYLRHGYVHFVTGVVPVSEEPEHVDDTILRKYGPRRKKCRTAS